MYYTLIIEDRHGIITNELTFERGSFTLGRVEDNDILLTSPNVSRRHARIYSEGDRCFVEDLNSSNGVLVDGRRIYGTAQLTSGSQIRIGDFFLVLKAKSQTATASPQHGGMQAQAQLGDAQQPRAYASLMYPRLVRVADVLEGETFALTERENTIGRTDDNTILLPDPSVSRHHAKVVIDAGRYIAVDLGSSNGTRVNEQTIYQPTLLMPGDVVRFGNVRFALASPGQTVNLREYRTFIAGSSRGLVVAITIMALLLVLVATGIGVFVILDRQPEEQQAVEQVEVTSPRERAEQLKSEGDTLAASEQWNDAIVRYELALNFDQSYQEAASALRRAQSEFNASRIIQEGDMNITSADRIERAGNPLEAVELYQLARERLLGVPPESTYWRRARDRITMLIDPALVDIHRTIGADRAANDEPREAAANFQRAMDIWRSLPEDRRPDILEDLRTRLYDALIAAGDMAYDDREWADAVGFYERAEDLGELRRDTSRRLRRARDRM